MYKYVFSITLLFTISTSVYASEKTAIIPFQNETGMSDRDYKAIYDTFRNKVSGNSSYELLSHDETIRLIAEAELNKKKITTFMDTIPVGQYLGVSTIIYGDVWIYEKRIYLNVYLVNIKNQSLMNKVTWSIPVTANPFNFAENSADKLLWKDRNIYPNHAVVISNRKKGNIYNSDYYENDMIKFLSSFNFPKSTEIIDVSTSIEENNKISIYGCVGCITLVGWLFLPTNETTSRVKIQIKLRYIDDFNNIQEVVITKEIKDNELFHWNNKENEFFSTTGKVYSRVKEEIKQDILVRKELFVERIR